MVFGGFKNECLTSKSLGNAIDVAFFKNACFLADLF